MHYRKAAALGDDHVEVGIAWFNLGNAFLERAFILETSDTLMPENFPEELFENQSVGRVVVDTRSTLAATRQQAAEHAERMYLQEQLAAHRGRIDATAASSGITPRQLHKLMTKHGLKKEDFKTGPMAQ